MIVVRKIPDAAIVFIRNEEGCVLHSYQDIAGYATIGIGHLIKSKESFPENITYQQAEDILRKDLLYTAASIIRLVKVPLFDSQYAALLSFVFNIGTGSFQASTARSRLNRGEYAGVPEAMQYWVYAGGRKSRGLINRRKREAMLFELEENYEETK